MNATQTTNESRTMNTDLAEAISLAEAYIFDCGDSKEDAASKAAEVFGVSTTDILKGLKS